MIGMRMKDHIAGVEHARLLVAGVCLDIDVAGRDVTPELRVRLCDGSRRGARGRQLGARRLITPIRYNPRTLALRTDGRPMASATPPERARSAPAR